MEIPNPKAIKFITAEGVLAVREPNVSQLEKLLRVEAETTDKTALLLQQAAILFSEPADLGLFPVFTRLIHRRRVKKIIGCASFTGLKLMVNACILATQGIHVDAVLDNAAALKKKAEAETAMQSPTT